MRKIRSLCFALLLLTPWVLAVPAAHAHSDSEKDKIESAFIYQFTNYIDWPLIRDQSEGAAPFVISVAGNSPIVAELEDLAKTKTVKGRKIAVHQFTDASRLTLNSSIIIIAVPDEDLLKDVIRRSKGTSALIVSFSRGFAEKGAMINFFLDEGRLRFEINRRAIENQNLRVGSQLLKLAKLIE